jgi:5,10-methylenetetrahydromethanopterin reductase
MGMVNEKGLRLAGEIADGSVLSVLASPAYVSWAREQIREGQQHRAESSHHRIVTYTLFSVDPDGDKARAAVRDATAFYLAAMPDTALSRVYGIQQDLDTLLARADVGELSRSMPNRWIDDLAVAGDPDECAEKLRALIDAGSDSVGLWLFPVDEGERIARLAASEVLNRL